VIRQSAIRQSHGCSETEARNLEKGLVAPLPRQLCVLQACLAAGEGPLEGGFAGRERLVTLKKALLSSRYFGLTDFSQVNVLVSWYKSVNLAELAVT